MTVNLQLTDGDGDQLAVNQINDGAEVEICQDTQHGVVATVVLTSAQCLQLAAALNKIGRHGVIGYAHQPGRTTGPGDVTVFAPEDIVILMGDS
jgi:hypothetical protein